MNRDVVRLLCSLPWRDVGLAAPDGWSGDGIRVNHVLVDCETPFVIAASSTLLANREELFGLCLVRDPAKLRAFAEGPCPPYHRPQVESLAVVFHNDFSDFFTGPKRFRINSGADAVGTGEEWAIQTRVEEIVLECAGLELKIRADDVVPMSVIVSARPVDAS